MELGDKVELSVIAARNMSVPGYTPRAKGDELSLEYLILWGGPGLHRILGKIDAQAKQNAALTAQIKALTAAVSALAAQSPEGIRVAFLEGIEKFREELEKIDVEVSLTSGETEDIRK